MDGIGACILSPNPKLGWLVNRDLAEPFEAYFKDGWEALDPRRRGLSRLRQGQVLIDDDVVTPDDIRTSPFFNELLPQAGFTWWMGAGFHSGENFYCLAVQRGTGGKKFTTDDKATFEGLQPTLSHLGRLLDGMRKETISATLSALESLSHAAVCMTDDGKILDWNMNAEKLLDRDFDIRNRRIVIEDKRAAAQFASALQTCVDMVHDGGFVIVPRLNKHSLLLRFSKLHPVVRCSFFGASILVSIREIAPPAVADRTILMQTFDLTQAEAHVASLLASGRSLDDAAKLLAISKDTARSHLKAIFAKTATHRQGELVALLSGIR